MRRTRRATSTARSCAPASRAATRTGRTARAEEVGHDRPEDASRTDQRLVVNAGTGNIGDAHVRASLDRADHTIVPEAAVRPSADLSDYHTGRGGAGNEHLAPTEKAPATAGTTAAAEAPNMGLADKLKKKIFGAFKK